MSETASAIGSAIWHTYMGDLDGCAMARTNSTHVRTQQTHVTKTRANHLTFLNARVGLWITRISRSQAVAS